MPLSRRARIIHILIFISAAALMVCAHGRDRFDGISLLATWLASGICWGLLGWHRIQQAIARDNRLAADAEDIEDTEDTAGASPTACGAR